MCVCVPVGAEHVGQLKAVCGQRLGGNVHV